MKYRDLANLFSDESTQVRTALRIYRCRPEIRKEIDVLLTSAAEPCGIYEIRPSGDEAPVCRISVRSLIHDYGLTPLDALLFIDWALRSDKDMQEALTSLLHRIQPPEVQPCIWPPAEEEVEAEYELQMAERAREEQRLKEEYRTIADKEIA